MQTRESGMPSEGMWREFFEAEIVLKKLGMTPACGDSPTSAAAMARLRSLPLASCGAPSTHWIASRRWWN